MERFFDVCEATLDLGGRQLAGEVWMVAGGDLEIRRRIDAAVDSMTGTGGLIQIAAGTEGVGRLLIADADARVRVLYPGEPRSEELALDARALMEPPPVGAVGLAAHPDFARNRLVYVAFVSVERSDTRLRVVRLRGIANTLGEPATIFEATVVASPGLPGVPLEPETMGWPP